MTRITSPSKEEFLERAKTCNLIPIYQEIWADTETAIGVFKKVGGRHSFLLESVEGGEKWGRYSFIGINPVLVFKSKGRSVVIEKDGKTEKREVDDPILYLKGLLDSYHPFETDGLPRFYGGAVGYLGYDIVRFFEDLPDQLPDKLKLADTQFMIPEYVFILDNLEQSIKVVCNLAIDDEKDLDLAYDNAVSGIEREIGKIDRPLPPESRELVSGKACSVKPVIPVDQFEAMVVKAKEYILAGDIIQVVLSQRFEADISSDPFDVYRALRRINPSPYLFFFRFDEVVLLGSSPEVMVRVEDDLATLRPIAGTRMRGATEKEDMALAEDLLADPKERAEHIMLVDLGRNDLGRVCCYGTVNLTELMVIERYSHVMHIVSNVEGRLRPGVNSFDVLRASFPAGTVSGAPKVRAMEIIEELESDKRGPYAGAVGYFGFSGNMDLGITIRSILIHNGKAMVQVGAGIVADSVPAKEYEETMIKGKALFKAVEMVGRGLR
ncbi:MAG: anthranilate synthase component I [Deltaproteobacteria bacterium]|jgi:anthranilate synthase component 1|nr:anthranilate synthase component I [Deltaproteobacteria bacterium]